MAQDDGEQALGGARQAAPAPNGYPAKPELAADPGARSLRDVCLELRERVDAFLAEEPETSLLREVQARLRVSMGVVEEALQRYQCVPPPPPPPPARTPPRARTTPLPQRPSPPPSVPRGF
jgi:hypothetical protein